MSLGSHVKEVGACLLTKGPTLGGRSILEGRWGQCVSPSWTRLETVTRGLRLHPRLVLWPAVCVCEQTRPWNQGEPDPQI